MRQALFVLEMMELNLRLYRYIEGKRLIRIV